MIIHYTWPYIFSLILFFILMVNFLSVQKWKQRAIKFANDWEKKSLKNRRSVGWMSTSRNLEGIEKNLRSESVGFFFHFSWKYEHFMSPMPVNPTWHQGSWRFFSYQILCIMQIFQSRRSMLFVDTTVLKLLVSFATSKNCDARTSVTIISKIFVYIDFPFLFCNKKVLNREQ